MHPHAICVFSHFDVSPRALARISLRGNRCHRQAHLGGLHHTSVQPLIQQVISLSMSCRGPAPAWSPSPKAYHTDGACLSPRSGCSLRPRAVTGGRKPRPAPSESLYTTILILEVRIRRSQALNYPEYRKFCFHLLKKRKKKRKR